MRLNGHCSEENDLVKVHLLSDTLILKPGEQYKLNLCKDLEVLIFLWYLLVTNRSNNGVF